MRIRIEEQLDAIAPARWNALVQDQNPFLRHEFLRALERHRCVGERAGWVPRYLLCLADDADDAALLGAVPLYVKDNSFGEFVFDWSWADAYRRHGLDYYPKLICALPFTPATGQRLLIEPAIAGGPRGEAVAQALIEGARAQAERLNCSSLHWLFLDQTDSRRLERAGFMTRLGCHFHWHNDGYASFDQFLAAFNAKKRKNIKRERRLVNDAGVSLRTLSGRQASEADWQAFYRFYSSTFMVRGRYPPLNLDFFLDIASTMGEQIVLVLASKSDRQVAGAISFKSASTLFGRHWGCHEEFDSLHFECCYYQNIEYCIQHGLSRFEPGVQGEHKVWRGFLPTLTRSAHWLAHPAFSDAIADFLRRETPAVKAYARELGEHSPFRQSAPAVTGAR